jgi:formylglycine-generating enzyme required for sulfatase activity
MNLTSQYVVNPNSRHAYLRSEATYKSIRNSHTKLRLGCDRQVLSLKDKNQVFRFHRTRIKMIYCSRGSFIMGDKFKNNSERVVTIDKPFLLSETEVTQELFETVMAYNPSRFQGMWGMKADKYPWSKQRPVEMVTWYDALMFCNKLSIRLGMSPYYNISITKNIKKENKALPNIESAEVTVNQDANGFRLPYEKEWEYAAKAGTDNQYAGAKNIDELKTVAWFSENSFEQTHPVKIKKPNEWGFYDMSGNVSEWCWDKANADSTFHVFRGGGWGNNESYSKSADRSSYLPGSRGNDRGFRVALNSN